MNFMAVGFVDVFDLAASLPRRLGLFRRGEDGETSVLHIRGPRRNTTEDACDLAWYTRDKHPELFKWPELRNQVEHIKTVADKMGEANGIKQEIGRVYLEQISHAKVLPWAEPLAGPYADRLTRLHLPIRTGPDAALFAGADQWRPPAGQIVIVNHRMPTSAVNFNLWPRVHLIIDLMRKEEVPQEAEQL
jgi:hypothetical protein